MLTDRKGKSALNIGLGIAFEHMWKQQKILMFLTFV